MCGGFVGDVLDAVTGAVESVGNAIGGAIDSVVHNPVGLIVDVGLLSMGVPPIYAGMAAGAANAAAKTLFEVPLVESASNTPPARPYASTWRANTVR